MDYNIWSPGDCELILVILVDLTELAGIQLIGSRLINCR